jgi:hypothetical protein
VKKRLLTQCYVDESVHASAGFVVTAFVFASGHFERAVAATLRDVGLSPGRDEFKSRTRMDTNPQMREARQALLGLADSKTRVAVFCGLYDRATIGLQALQSTLVRNDIRPSRLDVYFDQDILPSAQEEAIRLHRLFHFLRSARIHSREDSRKRLGIQVADAVAHSFGQILKEELSGKVKLIDIGGPNTGYEPGTKASLGWSLLMSLRRALLTRGMVYNGEKYQAAADPVVLDPVYDDPANYGQHPILLGWGVQVAPEAPERLRHAVERALGRIWLGCIH